MTITRWASLQGEEKVFIVCTAVCAAGAWLAWLLRPGGWFDQHLWDAFDLPAPPLRAVR